MRKLMAMFAICVSVATTSSWALVGMGDIKFDGSLEVSGNSANNELDQAAGGDHRGNTATRVRVGMSAEVTEGVNGRVEAIRTPRLYGTAPTTVAGEEALWTFHNAYIDVADILGLTNIRLGRQYVGNPGDLVWNVSPTDDDSLTNKSIDGILLNKKWDLVNVDLFTGKTSEDDGIANTDADDTTGDTNLSSFDLTFPTLIPGGALNAGYLWGNVANSSSTSDDNKLTIIRVGVRGGLAENLFTYRAEYFQNGGEIEAGATDTDRKSVV